MAIFRAKNNARQTIDISGWKKFQLFFSIHSLVVNICVIIICTSVSVCWTGHVDLIQYWRRMNKECASSCVLVLVSDVGLDNYKENDDIWLHCLFVLQALSCLHWDTRSFKQNEEIMKKCHTSRDQLTEHLRGNNSLNYVINLRGLLHHFYIFQALKF